jgi:hypothetical protein
LPRLPLPYSNKEANLHIAVLANIIDIHASLLKMNNIWSIMDC